MIKIIDYGLGNVLAFLNVYKRLNIPAEIAETHKDLKSASHIILPGVGSFDHAMTLLLRSGMHEALDELVLSKRCKVLGICVGMQILGLKSEEGKLSGLSWIEGSVLKLRSDNGNRSLRLPHMGWNSVEPIVPSPLFSGLESDARFYFLHSYHFVPQSRDSVLATVDYGIRFACAIHHENVFGVQFHPEKSHQYGVRLLKNFSEV